jgi:hypothetical protein
MAEVVKKVTESFGGNFHVRLYSNPAGSDVNKKAPGVAGGF